MIAIFVYGTLKKGFHNHHLLADSDFIGSAIIQGRLYELGGFPGLRDGAHIVHGELYNVSFDVLQRIDRLEGYSATRNPAANFYNREKRPVMIGGVPQDAQVYLFNRECASKTEIISGIYEDN